jgi:hypothetical protein
MVAHVSPTQQDQYGLTVKDYGIDEHGNWSKSSLHEAYTKMTNTIAAKYVQMINGLSPSFTDYEAAILLMTNLQSPESPIEVPKKIQNQAENYFKTLNKQLHDPVQRLLKGYKLDERETNLIGGQVYVLRATASSLNTRFRNLSPGKTPLQRRSLLKRLFAIGEKHEAVYWASADNKPGLLGYAFRQLGDFQELPYKIERLQHRMRPAIERSVSKMAVRYREKVDPRAPKGWKLDWNHQNRRLSLKSMRAKLAKIAWKGRRDKKVLQQRMKGER